MCLTEKKYDYVHYKCVNMVDVSSQHDHMCDCTDCDYVYVHVCIA